MSVETSEILSLEASLDSLRIDDSSSTVRIIWKSFKSRKTEPILEMGGKSTGLPDQT
jgi:hypothetical protein